MKKIQKGFTLIELMVAIAVVAILLVVGVPSLQRLLNSAEVTSNSNLFSSSVALARSEAAKRSTAVQVCASIDQATCSDADDWDMGWIVQVVATSEIIRVVEPEGTITVNTNNSAVVVSLDGVVRDDTGALFSTANTFQFCNVNTPELESVFLTINPLGAVASTRSVSACA